MTDAERERIKQEAYETLQRLNGLSVRDTSFDAPQEWQLPEPEDEVRYTEPTMTRRAAAVAEPPPAGVSEEYIVELVAHALAELTAEFDHKIDAVRAEVRELKAEAVHTFGNRLDSALAKATELCDRLERREPSGQVIDLPPLPRRTGRDVN
jgi:hypothetical protein